MSEDPFLNPINPEKVAQNPGLLPYAHTAGSAVIKPEDMGKTKGRSVKAIVKKFQNVFTMRRWVLNRLSMRPITYMRRRTVPICYLWLLHMNGVDHSNTVDFWLKYYCWPITRGMWNTMTN